MTGINDNNVYLSRMRRTFVDKAWFMQSIPSDVKTIVDFGSADNSFIDFLKRDYPEYRYVGIENNPHFLKISKERGQECHASLTEFMKSGSYDGDSTLLVLNSVLHEVYSYGFADTFWNEVMAFKPKYIAIRDMHAGDCGQYGSREMAEFESVACSDMNSHYVDFRRKWGRAYDGYTAIHFMLKYFYDENWERECDENYLPLSYRDLNRQIRMAGYDIEFEGFYALPYLRTKWKRDFHCDRNRCLKAFIGHATTHMKMLLVRAEEE